MLSSCHARPLLSYQLCSPRPPECPFPQGIPVDPVKDTGIFTLCLDKGRGYGMSSEINTYREQLRQCPACDAQSIEEEHQRLISKISSVVNTMVLPEILSLPGTSPAASACALLYGKQAPLCRGLPSSEQGFYLLPLRPELFYGFLQQVCGLIRSFCQC